ncbi:hypothetical protein D3C87_2022570 [compost metagenome]
MWAIWVVPGIGTIHGFRASSQARAIWPGAACLRAAQVFNRATKARFPGTFSVEKRPSFLRMSPSA